MQKSTVDESQRASGVKVIVGVADGTIVGTGDVFVGMIFVFTGVGVSVSGEFAQEARTRNKKRSNISFGVSQLAGGFARFASLRQNINLK